MKSRVLGQFLVAAALLAGAADASTKNSGSVPATDADIAKQVRHEIAMYPRFTIWDDVSFRVSNGAVSLLGEVNQPYKKDDLARIVQRVPGVASLTNELKVLPLSPQDDQLRLQVARAIYGDPAFFRYRNMAVPPIHIIVENGRVMLTGSVNSTLEKEVAGIRASGAGLSFGPIVNNLEVENPPAKKS